MNPSTLFVIGVPLDDTGHIDASSRSAVASADLIIGESAKATLRLLKQVPESLTKPRFFLDQLKPHDDQALEETLGHLSRSGGGVALFSDTGMPILFDPGKTVLERCLKLGFHIQCRPGPTSWGTAMALCGFVPPFLLLGFPPRKTDERAQLMKGLARHRAHMVLMDTPYRFHLLLKDALEAFGKNRNAFVAWEISKPNEAYLWGTLKHLQEETGRRGFNKGEFILIVESQS